jgi:hypothetical protein
LNYYKGKADAYDNKCHTKNRFNCYSIEIDFGKINTVEYAHLWNNAVDCAKQVLSGEFIRFTYIGLFALLALLI